MDQLKIDETAELNTEDVEVIDNLNDDDDDYDDDDDDDDYDWHTEHAG